MFLKLFCKVSWCQRENKYNIKYIQIKYANTNKIWNVWPRMINVAFQQNFRLFLLEKKLQMTTLTIHYPSQCRRIHHH